MARAKSTPARVVRSPRRTTAPHTRKVSAQMKSTVDVAATIVMGDASTASATRSPLSWPQVRTRRATPTTAAAAATAVARLTSR